jgi:hypothetical protein
VEQSGRHVETSRPAEPTVLDYPSPGWYGNPEDAPHVARWWDGSEWTHVTRACLMPLPPPESLPRAAG